MSKRHALLTAVAAAHVGLVVYCAAGLLTGSGEDLPSQAVRWYGLMSGAANRYGFFAEVGSGCRVTFIMTDRNGRSWTDTLDRGANREAEMRCNGSIYKFVSLGEPLVRSWAATMFGRHPEAHQVLVRFETYDIPAMADYDAGARPSWQVRYQRFFLRKEVDTPARSSES